MAVWSTVVTSFVHCRRCPFARDVRVAAGRVFSVNLRGNWETDEGIARQLSVRMEIASKKLYRCLAVRAAVDHTMGRRVLGQFAPQAAPLNVPFEFRPLAHG
jgi:hypothetical protein